MTTALKVGIITVSDRCSSGESEDCSGPAVAEFLKVELTPAPSTVNVVVPDDKEQIQAVVRDMCDVQRLDFVVTTGGTGFAVRDVTPEAVGALLHRQAPGVVHAMMSFSLTATPFAWLSRPVAGVRGGTVVVTVPGSPKAAIECLTPLVKNGLVHAIALAGGDAKHAHPTVVTPDAAPAAKASSVPDVVARDRVSTFAMVPMPDALAAIQRNAPPSIVVKTPIVGAAGHVLATAVTTSFPHPPFRASIKDGYAVVSGDGTGEFQVTGTLCAGSSPAPGFVLQPGSICRVNTGGEVPEGADAVVQVEDTQLVRHGDGEEAVVRITKKVAAGTDVRPIGCDLELGGVAVPAGAVMHAPECGLALSVGASHVDVYRRPRIAVLSTGDELTDVTGDTPPAGKIFDSNKGMLLAAAKPYGSAVVDVGIAADNLAATRQKLEAAFSQADVIISTGGVSMGEVDCVKAILDEMGATVHFGRVNMKPGKPTTFATKDGKLFFALPGNPVSAMVCFHVFVVPVLRSIAGHDPERPLVQAKLAHRVALDKERPEYHRCRLTFDMAAGGFAAASTGIQASHRLLSLAGANGLMVLPAATAECGSIDAGATVPVMVIGDILNGAVTAPTSGQDGQHYC
jgi:gephyrin